MLIVFYLLEKAKNWYYTLSEHAAIQIW